MIQDVQPPVTEEEELDARLANLLHLMHSRHLASEESQPVPSQEPAISRAAM